MSRQSRVLCGLIQDTKGCTLEMASGSLAYNEIATAAGCARDVWPERERDWEDTQAFYTGQQRPEQGYLSVGWTGLDNIEEDKWVRNLNQSDYTCGCGWYCNYDSLMHRELTDDRDPGRVRNINWSILCGLISSFCLETEKWWYYSWNLFAKTALTGIPLCASPFRSTYSSYSSSVCHPSDLPFIGHTDVPKYCNLESKRTLASSCVVGHGSKCPKFSVF